MSLTRSNFQQVGGWNLEKSCIEGVIVLFAHGCAAVGAELVVLGVQEACAAGSTFGVLLLFPERLIFVENECVALALDSGKILFLETDIES